MILSLEQLNQVKDRLIEEIERGLKASDQQVQALPAYLRPPHPEMKGRALVFDAGGTNMRASLVTLSGQGEGAVEAGPVGGRIPDGRSGQAITADEFFTAQAQLAQSFQAQRELPLGYCFSYPAEVFPDGDARLLRWTKGVDIPEVVGMKVGSALREALARAGVKTTGVAVLNDTVASLAGGAYLSASEEFEERFIGLIVGTGTNMAANFGSHQLTKVDSFDGRQLVNLESGNFHPPCLQDFDDAYDAGTGNPGRQRLEKAVSGYYLPFLYDQIHPGKIRPEKGSAQLVKLRGSGDPTAAALLTRSAQLVAAGLAGVAHFYGPGRVAVLGEGSLLWGDPDFAGTLQTTLDSLLGPDRATLLKQRENVNLFGAAAAVLSRELVNAD